MSWTHQRSDHDAAAGFLRSLAGGTTCHDLDRPTPCRDFTVRLLLGHLIGVADRDRACGGGELSTAPHVVTDVADDLLVTIVISRLNRAVAVWRARRGNDLVRAPWGLVTAADALHGFTVELLTHGWDLAVATGQPAHLDDVAERCLDRAQDGLVPARLRGVMYDETSPAGDVDSATERLVHLLGHRR